MGTRSLVAWVALVVALGVTRTAAADAKAEVVQKSKEAMENYDLMDYEAAKKLLNQAINAARKLKLDKDPVTARAYLFLGIATFAGGDQDGAKAAFASAVKIDPKIQIDAAYKSPELVKLLEAAKAGGSTATTPTPTPEPTPPDPGPAVDCSGVKGVEHTILDTGKAGAPQPIEALVGSDLTPVKVSVMYRPEGAVDFVEVKMTKQGECKYVASIPASGMRGKLVHYYVAAYNSNDKPIAGKGSAGSPNIIEITGVAPPVKPDEEDPINGNKKPVAGGGGGGGGSVSGGVIAGGKAPKVYIAVMGGTGFGYVTGKTEFDNEVENCCIGNSLAVVTPELGYYVNRKLSVGLAARLGIPVGANINGHSTVAPAAVVRLRYSLTPTGEGLRVMGQLGGGILRNTIKLNNAMQGMDTDIVAQGPLLVGAGVGFTKKLSGSVAFVADLSALGAVAVVKKLGTTPNLNSGVGADLSLGFALGF